MGQQEKELVEGQVFLIAHTTESGHNVGQATIVAKSEQAAKERFRLDFPGREILTTGVKGVG